MWHFRAVLLFSEGNWYFRRFWIER